MTRIALAFYLVVLIDPALFAPTIGLGLWRRVPWFVAALGGALFHEIILRALQPGRTLDVTAFAMAALAATTWALAIRLAVSTLANKKPASV